MTLYRGFLAQSRVAYTRSSTNIHGLLCSGFAFLILYLVHQPRFITILLLVASFGNGEEEERCKRTGIYMKWKNIFYYVTVCQYIIQCLRFHLRSRLILQRSASCMIRSQTFAYKAFCHLVIACESVVHCNEKLQID